MHDNVIKHWIHFKKDRDAEIYCFLWSVPEQMVEEETIETPAIWDAIALIMTSL